MGAAFSDEQISKWCQDYEKEICAKYDFIVARLSLEIIAGQGEYELPNYVTNIRSVLYKGKELHAKGGRSSILTGDIPFVSSNSSPYEYQFSGMGLRVIRLLPTPGDNLPAYIPNTRQGFFTVLADKDHCIVEFYRTSIYTGFNSGLNLPVWLRRYILKDYVCWKAFASEGPQQDSRAAAYYETRMMQNEVYCSEIKSNMFRGYQRILSDTKMVGRRKPGRPVLPPNFGLPTYGG